MAELIKYVLLAIAVAYWVAMVLVFFKAARHSYAWWLNSTPPLRKFGSLVEGYTIFFGRYLTKEGIEHRNKSGKWFLIFLGMIVVWAVIIELLSKSAT